MKTTQLLTEFEALTHHDRVQRMVAIGRQPLADREVLLDDLSRGAVYERLLALFSCFGSRDGGRAAQAVLDPSEHVAGPARRLVALLGTDEQMLTLLPQLPPAGQRQLLMAWRKAGRSAGPVDEWVQRTLEEDPAAAQLALPYASSDLVQQLFPALLDEPGLQPMWLRVARWHPVVAGQELLRRAQNLSEPAPQVTAQVNLLLPVLAKRDLDLGLNLVQALGRTTPLGHLRLQHLALVRPEAVAELVLSSEDSPGPLTLTPRLRHLPYDVVAALLRHRPGILPHIEQAYGTLPPAARQRLASVVLEQLTTSAGVLPLPIAQHLPADLRIQEARRHVDLPTLQTRPTQRLTYAALLPWGDARALLDTPLRSPDPDLRAQALTSLAFAVRYDRFRQTELLALLTARRHEQDPVRLAMLSGLADLPPSLWQVSSLDALGQVLQVALDAADLSHQTARQALRLILRLLPFHPEWSAAWLARFVQARGQVQFGRLERHLTAATAPGVMAALLPVFQAWATREREDQLLQGIESLGRYIRGQADLFALLEQRIRQSKERWIPLRALSLLQAHEPQRFATLVPQLLREDASWATQAVIYDHLHRQRQDLLTPFLGRRAFAGRFSTGKTRIVLPFMTGFTRWTRTQQQTFAATLIEVIQDTQRGLPGVWTALGQLAALPTSVPLDRRPGLLARLSRAPGDAQLDRLTALAQLDASNPALRDRALRSLGQLDEARGVPALLAALEDDRARIALYALRRPLLAMAPDQALDLLLGVPRERVTVFKEVVRLIGELRGDRAYRALLDFSTEDLHRDVRVALLRGLWNHLGQAETWPVLLAAAQSGDVALSSGLVRLPGQALTGHSGREYLALVQALLGHPDATVRLATLHFHQPLTDPERILLPTLLQRLTSPYSEETTAAAGVIFASYGTPDAQAIGEAFRQLLPDRRALQAALQALQAVAASSPHRTAPLIQAVLEALATDSLTLTLQVQLAVAAEPWPALGARLQHWTEQGQLHAEALMAGVTALKQVHQRPDVGAVPALQAVLLTGNELARRLALEVLILEAAALGGWTAERLRQLQTYRADPSPLVAGAAQFTLPEMEQATT
ncbi:hypothetical protein GO986_09855 [Deinococcus sp. HMF7620]|uniref:HEAT repeat domain-containing protein n=1 Tax=Deinococcus arboris TaxID=2682977 RepID=A0A7C9I335_9DEIO|nr:hypothetical protein [Deinococcus arboris]MVN87071.1 hypothetical protein [Deinococcus arboris]